MSSVIVPKIRSTKEKVRRLLLQDYKYRDNDEILVARYWWNELNILNQFSEQSWKQTKDFLTIYGQGKLTSADVITRARRQLQEKEPELRGTKWKERHDEEKLVRDEINEKTPKTGG